MVNNTDICYIQQIDVHSIFHLKDFSIQMDEKFPHLILTGKNGSGKTILLNAVKEFLGRIQCDGKTFEQDVSDNTLSWEEFLGAITGNIISNKNIAYKIRINNRAYQKVFGKLQLYIPDIRHIWKKYHEGSFILAYYGATRKTSMYEPDSPTKPSLSTSPDIDFSYSDQFLNFLSDLKIQEALARNERLDEDADRIREWFESFEGLLRELYEDEDLHLVFNYRDYSFRIHTKGKLFKFTELSDGFMAATDIIADLILKMQQDDSLVRVFDKPGIVLIDEIETHLHLSLQKNILKILTRVFPKIQFIVTTHSPFVLSSLDNATAFDLENRQKITDLSEYSYESLAEGYFGVSTESSYIGMKLEQLKKLLEKKSLEADEAIQKDELIREFEQIPEIISPLYVGEFRQLMIKNHSSNHDKTDQEH